MTVLHVHLITGKAADETPHLGAMSMPGLGRPSAWTAGKLGCLLLHPFTPMPGWVVLHLPPSCPGQLGRETEAWETFPRPAQGTHTGT